MTSTTEDIDSLVPETDTILLSTGHEVRLNRIKTRETLSLLRIITRGSGEVLSNMNLSLSQDMDEFATTVMAALIFAIPEAEDETIEFVQLITLPAEYKDKVRNKAEAETNDLLQTELLGVLANPELDDLITIIERVVQNESGHFLALGKRLASLIKTFTQSGAAKKSNASSKPASKRSTRAAS